MSGLCYEVRERGWKGAVLRHFPFIPPATREELSHKWNSTYRHKRSPEERGVGSGEETISCSFGHYSDIIEVESVESPIWTPLGQEEVS